MIKPQKFHHTNLFRRTLPPLMALMLMAGLVFALAACQEATPSEKPPVLPSATSTSTAAPLTPSPIAPSPTPAPTATATLDSAPYFQDLPLSQTSYILPLTIRHTAEDSAVLFFELDHPAGGQLFVRQLTGGEKLIQSIPLSEENLRQQIVVSNLEPGTEYEAVVLLLNDRGEYEHPGFLGSGWGSVRFHTQTKAEPLRVGVIGDSGFGEEITAELIDQMAAQNLDFVIHTGDVIYKGGENASPAEAFAVKFYRPFSPILHRMPVYPVPGNHEYENAIRWQDAPFYYYAFPPYPDPLFDGGSKSESGQYYAFAYQGVQFLMLDSQVFWGQPSRAEQDAWLQERLTDPRFAYSIPVFHIPPFNSSAIHPDDSVPLRQFWYPLFASVRVPLVLSGHNHHYERLNAGDITYIVSGGGSGALYGLGTTAPESQFFAAKTHFVLLEISLDRIDISAIDAKGVVFDQASVPVAVFHKPSGD